MTSFVFVPGAGGNASAWNLVGPLLEAAGHESTALDLPSDDETVGLDEYADLAAAAVGTRPDVVLVAMSLGGFTAPLVAARVPLAEIVLINAMLPLPGERAEEWWDATDVVSARESAAARHGYSLEVTLDEYFLHDVPPAVVEAAGPGRDEAAAAFESVCAFTKWPAVPTRILAGADDRFFPVEFQERVARDRLALPVDTLPGGHLLPWSNPHGVLRYLTRA